MSSLLILCTLYSVVISSPFKLQRTFSELSDPADLHRKCQELCQSLSEDMQKEGVWVSATVTYMFTIILSLSTEYCDRDALLH